MTEIHREKIQVVSGPTIDDSQPGHEPFFRVVLKNNIEWHITGGFFIEYTV